MFSVKSSTVIVFLLGFIALISFSCSDYSPERYKTSAELDDLLTRISAYTEKKPRHISYADRFNAEHRTYYQRVAGNLNSRIEQLYVNDSLHYFLLVKNDAKSLYKEKRAVGGIFKLERDSIVEMEIQFITPMLVEEELTRKGAELFKSMVKNENMDEYFGNPAYMEWPNPNVSYDKATNRWVFPDNSELAVFKNIMTGQK